MRLSHQTGPRLLGSALGSSPFASPIVVTDRRRPSGLWLAARQPDLLLPPSATSQLDGIVMCVPSPAELGFRPATLNDVIELVSELPFEPAMLAMTGWPRSFIIIRTIAITI
jgi:hypothetical protein